MSRATQLAKLGRTQLLAEWFRACGAAPVHIKTWAADHATKEQLAAMIVVEEEHCQSQPPK